MIGLLGRKKGMAAVFDERGRHTPVTVLAVGPCTVMEVKSRERHGYDAIKVAFEPVGEGKVTKPVLGQFRRANLSPHQHIWEFRGVKGEYQVGAVLGADVFRKGDKVKVVGISKGRGFAGVVKRHHFGRPNQTHGTHEIFRGSGSVGAHSFPARTWPGQRMAGRMGGRRVTVKNLTVVDVEPELGLLMVRGAVPGAPGGLVQVLKLTD